jgi:16S rRNA processing protein RimM
MDSGRSEPVLVEIARVVRPHGLHGELRVEPFWAESRTLYDVSDVELLGPGASRRSARIAAVRPAHRSTLVRLEGVADRDAAAALRGTRLAVPRDRLPAPASGEYYLVDLVGAEVLAPGDDEQLASIGRVIGIRQLPSVDVLVIETADGGEREQPLGAPWIRSVDAVGGRVVLNGTDALL